MGTKFSDEPDAFIWQKSRVFKEHDDDTGDRKRRRKNKILSEVSAQN